jgi:hypothetical protein
MRIALDLLTADLPPNRLARPHRLPKQRHPQHRNLPIQLRFDLVQRRLRMQLPPRSHPFPQFLFHLIFPPNGGQEVKSL